MLHSLSVSVILTVFTSYFLFGCWDKTGEYSEQIKIVSHSVNKLFRSVTKMEYLIRLTARQFYWSPHLYLLLFPFTKYWSLAKAHQSWSLFWNSLLIFLSSLRFTAIITFQISSFTLMFYQDCDTWRLPMESGDIELRLIMN